MSITSIALVDDHPILLDGLASIFAEDRRYKVVGKGSCASDAVALMAKSQPDIVLLDLNMPGDAFQTITVAQQEFPEIRIVVFTASASVEHAVRALEAGAKGYVLKGSTDTELMQAIEMVVIGERYISPNFASKVISALHNVSIRKRVKQGVRLTVREDQIVRLLLVGRTNKEIAHRLEISEKTVKHYMTLLMQKLQARNRVEVVLAAQELDCYLTTNSAENSVPAFLN